MSAHLPANATAAVVRIPIGGPAPRRQRARAGIRRTGKAEHKRNLIAAARVLGWQGKSYRKAKRFERKLERKKRAAGGSR